MDKQENFMAQKNKAMYELMRTIYSTYIGYSNDEKQSLKEMLYDPETSFTVSAVPGEELELRANDIPFFKIPNSFYDFIKNIDPIPEIADNVAAAMLSVYDTRLRHDLDGSMDVPLYEGAEDIPTYNNIVDVLSDAFDTNTNFHDITTNFHSIVFDVENDMSSFSGFELNVAGNDFYVMPGKDGRAELLTPVSVDERLQKWVDKHISEYIEANVMAHCLNEFTNNLQSQKSMYGKNITFGIAGLELATISLQDVTDTMEDVSEYTGSGNLFLWLKDDFRESEHFDELVQMLGFPEMEEVFDGIANALTLVAARQIEKEVPIVPRIKIDERYKDETGRKLGYHLYINDHEYKAIIDGQDIKIQPETELYKERIYLPDAATTAWLSEHHDDIVTDLLEALEEIDKAFDIEEEKEMQKENEGLFARLVNEGKILEFYEGIHIEKPSDMPKEKADRLINDYPEYIENVKSVMSRNIPKTAKSLETLVGQLFDPNTKFTIVADSVFEAIKMNGKHLIEIPNNYKTFDIDFGPFEKAEALANNYLKMLQNACEEKGVDCPDLMSSSIRDKIVDSMVDLETRAYAYNEASVKRGLIEFNNETITMGDKNAHVFYVNKHPFALYADEKGNSVTEQLPDVKNPVSEIEQRCFDRNKDNITQVADYAVKEKLIERTKELLSTMKMSVSRDRRVMSVLVNDKEILSFNNKDISQALNYDSATKTMHGDLYGYCAKTIEECDTVNKLKEELNIPELKGALEIVERELLDVLVPVVDKRLHVMPEIDLAAVYDKERAGGYLTLNEIEAADAETRKFVRNQCSVNGRPYTFDFRGDKVCGLHPLTYDFKEAVHIETPSEGEKAWVMNHYKDIRKELDIMVEEFKEKEYGSLSKHVDRNNREEFER